ncbi:hypothetical protein BJ508DRAFT_309805 [Ascobolus immersus RN42]|uniref:Uncharacterized protein n=1 Tax=Ascobolus immersus RN42 TaxID=1160509 RepID=A0A3N4I7R9_ASCIM|nr:hypothetical protein BJ508DRAFT_309805 [Ascobolus immersus RN42]
MDHKELLLHPHGDEENELVVYTVQSAEQDIVLVLSSNVFHAPRHSTYQQEKARTDKHNDTRLMRPGQCMLRYYMASQTKTTNANKESFVTTLREIRSQLSHVSRNKGAKTTKIIFYQPIMYEKKSRSQEVKKSSRKRQSIPPNDSTKAAEAFLTYTHNSERFIRRSSLVITQLTQERVLTFIPWG